MKRVSSRQRLVSWDLFDAHTHADSDNNDDNFYETKKKEYYPVSVKNNNQKEIDDDNRILILPHGTEMDNTLLYNKNYHQRTDDNNEWTMMGKKMHIIPPSSQENHHNYDDHQALKNVVVVVDSSFFFKNDSDDKNNKSEEYPPQGEQGTLALITTTSSHKKRERHGRFIQASVGKNDNLNQIVEMVQSSTGSHPLPVAAAATAGDVAVQQNSVLLHPCPITTTTLRFHSSQGNYCPGVKHHPKKVQFKLDTLMEDVQYTIISFLNLQEIVSLGNTCTYFRSLIRSTNSNSISTCRQYQQQHQQQQFYPEQQKLTIIHPHGESFKKQRNAIWMNIIIQLWPFIQDLYSSNYILNFILIQQEEKKIIMVQDYASLLFYAMSPLPTFMTFHHHHHNTSSNTQSDFVCYTMNVSWSNKNHLQQEQEQYLLEVPVIQFISQVGNGNRCLKSNIPFPSPQYIQHSSLLIYKDHHHHQYESLFNNKNSHQTTTKNEKKKKILYHPTRTRPISSLFQLWNHHPQSLYDSNHNSLPFMNVNSITNTTTLNHSLFLDSSIATTNTLSYMNDHNHNHNNNNLDILLSFNKKNNHNSTYWKTNNNWKLPSSPTYQPFVYPHVAYRSSIPTTTTTTTTTTEKNTFTNTISMDISPRLVYYYEISILQGDLYQEEEEEKNVLNRKVLPNRRKTTTTTTTTSYLEKNYNNIYTSSSIMNSNNNNKNIKECIAIGWVDSSFSIQSNIMPGWDTHSYGYHSDDGGIFHSRGDMLRIFGPTFGVGDVVGCGINYENNGIFYTLNGNFLGYAWIEESNLTTWTKKEWYPCVGVDTNHPLYCNFGYEVPFCFDLSSFLCNASTG